MKIINNTTIMTRHKVNLTTRRTRALAFSTALIIGRTRTLAFSTALIGTRTLAFSTALRTLAVFSRTSITTGGTTRFIRAGDSRAGGSRVGGRRAGGRDSRAGVGGSRGRHYKKVKLEMFI